MNERVDGKTSSLDLDGRIRIIKDLELRHPAINIGLEEAIVEAVSGGGSISTIRFWRNRRSAIIGRSQEAGAEVYLGNCRSSQIPLVRRPTGGGSVLHHPNNLNYSIYLPEAHTTSVKEQSRALSKPLASALSELGLDIRVRSNGLFVGSNKIGGTAQSRRRGLLHHGTLLVEGDGIMENMDKFLRAGGGGYSEVVSRVASEPDPVSSLVELVGSSISVLDLIDAIVQGLAGALGGRPVEGEITDQEWRLASYLAETKYSSSTWNFRFHEE